MKSCAFVDFRFTPDCSAVPVNDSLNDRQANARTFEVLLPVESLEDSKEFVGTLHRESDSVVFH